MACTVYSDDCALAGLEILGRSDHWYRQDGREHNPNHEEHEAEEERPVHALPSLAHQRPHVRAICSMWTEPPLATSIVRQLPSSRDMPMRASPSTSNVLTTSSSPCQWTVAS